MEKYKHIPFNIEKLDEKESLRRSELFYENLSKRRSVRFFSEKSFDKAVIDNIIKTAGTAPSGANKQPWHFAIVQDPAIKKEIRIAAEKEEKEFYEHRAPDSWL